MNIKSMKLTPKEQKADTVEAQENEAPKYPWGLCLYLDEDAMNKLGVGKLDVGTIVQIAGSAKVTGYSEREYEGGSHKTLDLQITALGVEAPGDDTSDLAAKMYPAK